MLDESNFSENYGIIGYSMKKEENDMKVLYTAVVTNTGGRSGKAYSSDGKFEVNVATPVEMGGRILMLLIRAAFCSRLQFLLQRSFELVLRKNRVRFESTQVAASVSLWKILRIMASRLPCICRPASRESARKRLRST